MRFARTYLPVLSFLLLALPTLGQQTSTTTPQSSPQALSLLQKSLLALTGGQSITDVTLSGTARRIAGSDDESGTATLKALASGAGRIDLALSGGVRSETSNLIVTPPVGAWTGPDGISHPIAFHNLLSEPAWFFPAFAISRRLSNSGYVTTYVGPEARNSQAVEHISISQTPPLPNPPGGATFEHLTQVDIFLDSTTLLPAAITFNVHPDKSALVDLLVEIDFSNYTAVSGAQVPFHIQKFLNNSLLLDFQTQSVTPNSGLSAANFQVQ